MAPRHRAAVRPVHRTGRMGVLVFVVAPLLAATLFLLDTRAAHAGGTSDRITWQTVGTRATPCPYEDTIPKRTACYWDATKRGNKKGVSFVVWPSGWRMVLAR